jgi:hypothetical protein
MSSKRFLGALLAAGIGIIQAAPIADAGAAPPPPKKEAAAASFPPMTTKPITLSFPGIVFGMPPNKVADAIDAIIDADYKPKYKEVSPGVNMRALDAEVAERKAEFRRSRIDFGKLPTGVDASPLRGEYTYNNKETLMTLSRNGENVHFFFIQDRLWKMIGEHHLSETSSYGKDFQASVTKFAGIYGVAGRVLQPDGKARFAVEVDWKDANNHLRIIQRSDTAIGVALEDITTWQALASLRTNKPSEDNGIDPAVAAAVRKDDAPPGPPDKKAPPPPKKK